MPLQNGTLLALGTVAIVAGVRAATAGAQLGSRSRVALRTTPFRVVVATAQESAGMYNPPVVIELSDEVPLSPTRTRVRRSRIVTAAGTSDDLDVYRYGDNVLVVVKNLRMPYVGATLYTREGAGPWTTDQDVFFQGSEQAEEALGKRWEDWSDRTLAKHLLDVMS